VDTFTLVLNDACPNWFRAAIETTDMDEKSSFDAGTVRFVEAAVAPSSFVSG
jgi:hypothetical protein